jgi:hypothetical protein
MKRLLFLAAFATAVAVPADAHHSFARYYFEKDTVSVVGEIVEFEYRSPHAWVHVMVPDQNGQMQRFSAEWFNTTRLKRLQIAKDTLKPGDHVIITGSPGRDATEHKLHLKGIQRPADGWKWGNVQTPR